MNRAVWFGLVVGLVAVVGGLVFLRYYDRSLSEEIDALTAPAPLPPQAAAEPTPEPAEPEPVITHPVPEPAGGRPPLPELDDSDAEMLGALRGLFGAETVDSFLVPRELIRRLVLTVDSMDRDPLPAWLRPLRRVPGNFAVDGQEQTLAIKADNAQRYTLLAAALGAVDVQALAALYRRYYPLFQDAYDRLGNPRARYFNDRLINVIDHLLDTPELTEPIALVRPKVLYLYADPELEELSSGQKMLLRIGTAHRATAKAKLREFRAAIVTGAARS